MINLAVFNPHSNSYPITKQFTYVCYMYDRSIVFVSFRHKLHRQLRTNSSCRCIYSAHYRHYHRCKRYNKFFHSLFVKITLNLLLGSSTSVDSYDPTFGAWNVLNCRTGGNFVLLPLSQPNAHGLIVAVDIYPRSGGSYPQTIFAIRNSANSAISFTVEFGSNMYVYAYQVDNGGYWNLRFSSLTALTNGNISPSCCKINTELQQSINRCMESVYY